MKKIFINTPMSRDANSFWRCMGPMSYLAKNSGGDIQIYLPPTGQQLAWDRLSEFDLIFLHRPCSMDDVTVLQIARNLNIPVWCDFDDWLFELPEWNPHASQYHNQTVQHCIAMVLACSDVVSVSTQALYEQFSKINKHVVILPNAYRSDLFPYRTKEVPNRDDLFVWRGTNTHDGDLHSVRKAFPSLGFKTVFLGSPSYAVTTSMDPNSYEKRDHTDVIMYWKMLHQLKARAMLFPLKDCFFNHAKSNIAWIEAIHSGALCIAPRNMLEWEQPGVIHYETDDWFSFLECADKVMRMTQEQVKAQVNDAYHHIRSKYDISVVNEIRTALVDSIFHPTFERNNRDPFSQLTPLWALAELKKASISKIES